MRSARRGTSRASIRWTLSNASSGSMTGSFSARTVLTARSRTFFAFSSTKKPQAKSDPWRSPAKEMGVPTISRPMWQGPSSPVPEEIFCTAFSMLWLQRRSPSLAPREAVRLRFCSGMMMPLPWWRTNPRASVKESSMPHQRRTVSRIRRTICSSSRRVESIGITLPQLLLQRPVAQVGDLGDGPGPVDRDHRGQGADQARVFTLDQRELLGGLVAFELDSPAADALQRDGGGHVEEERKVRAAREAVGLVDELVRDAGALVGERGERVAVEDDVLAAGEARLDLRVEVVEPVGGEQQRHHALVDHAQLPVRLGGGRAAREDLPDEQAYVALARLVREIRRPALLLQPLREQVLLRGGAGAVQALEDDEAAV